MRRIPLFLGTLALVATLSGCVYEHHGRAVTTQTVTENPDGTTTVTKTEVVREPAYSPGYVSPWWGWGYYPYYYRPYPAFGYYYGYRPYYHHHR